MLRKLFEKLTTSIATQQLNELPAVQYGRLAIETYWTGNREVTQDFSGQFVKDQAVEMMKEVIEVASSPDPRLANRERLAGAVLQMAQLQVLVIDPPPAPDPTGLRGQPGITGELQERLLELAQKDKRLRKFMHGFDTPKRLDDVWNPVLLQYRTTWALAQVFCTLRLAFDDVNKAEGKDWFMPFLAAQCAWEEHQYRKSLGMPPALKGSGVFSAEATALFMGLFQKLVRQGVQYPDLEWRDRLNIVERGGD
jgi:hypothetical protein